MVQVHVIHFAAARELAQCSSEHIELGQPSLGHLRQVLAERHPRLAGYLARMRFAVNGEFADEAVVLREGDEVTVLPPVAGGSVLAEVRHEPLSIDEVVRAVTHPSAGAVSIFLGVVRDHHEGAAVERLDYEAYEELANKEMARIVEALQRRDPSVRVAALHRAGELAIGDTAVVVAASAPHRAEAFAACREVIDAIKDRAPIWKKEWAPDGSALWVNLEADERS